MNQKTFDYFESPKPNSFNPMHLRDKINEIYDDPLFYTPVRPVQHSSMIDTGAIQHSQESDSEDEYQQYDGTEINRRILFDQSSQLDMVSQEEEQDASLVNFIKTPEKKEDSFCEGATTGYKNRGNETSNSKPCERGLKKLAHDAYVFVSNQRKTSYKQVAKELIENLNEYGSQFNYASIVDDKMRKGQMNIKRRVYDALNVMIALGVLKRIGNKLLIRKVDVEGRKERVLEDQLHHIRKNYQIKNNLLEQKKKYLEELQEKTDSVRNIVYRNAKHTFQKNQNTKHKIELPVLSITLQKSQNSSESNLNVFQPNPETLVCKSKENKIEIISDIDMMRQLRNNQQNKVTVDRKIKTDRRRAHNK